MSGESPARAAYSLSSHMDPSDFNYVGSGVKFNIDAVSAVSISAFQIAVLSLPGSNSPLLEVWFKNSPDFCTSLKSRAEWKNMVGEVTSRDESACGKGCTHRIALLRPVSLDAGQRVSFYIWSGGEDCIKYTYSTRSLQSAAENADLKISPGKFNDSVGDRWTNLSRSGLLSGVVEYDVVKPRFAVAEMPGEIIKDLGSAFGSESFSDLTIVIGHDRIRTHCVVLAARSKVFAAMLSSPMKEAATKEVVLQDIEMPVLKELLRFIYTGEVDKAAVMATTGFAMELLCAAHRFELLPLVRFCEQTLGSKLEDDTVVDVLQVAVRLGCSTLQKACLEHVVENAGAVQTKASFKDMAATNPSLMLEVFAALAGTLGSKRRRTE
mmetsp:Transcript_43741/g.93060  ORF Transcript_43741/g.93060 Transcript_43741/m.93060 type:complete len:380 (-) Transcript_43741:111-1250(-)